MKSGDDVWMTEKDLKVINKNELQIILLVMIKKGIEDEEQRGEINPLVDDISNLLIRIRQ